MGTGNVHYGGGQIMDIVKTSHHRVEPGKCIANHGFCSK